MKPITLQTAIQVTIRIILGMGQSFSAYDITKAIRASVDKDYILSDVLETQSRFDSDLDDMVQYTIISHESVKSIINELFEHELFDATVEYVNDGISTYKKYVPVDAPEVHNATPPAAPTTTPDWYDKVLPYLERKGGATAKEIQSALKIKGVTCEDILDALGIPPNALAPSKTFVFVNH